MSNEKHENAYIIVDQKESDERSSSGSSTDMYMTTVSFTIKHFLSLRMQSCWMLAQAQERVWSLGLAKTVPSTVAIHAVDISTTFFPDPKEVPPNVHFSHNTIFSLPAQWTCHFDFISLKHLAAAISVPQWRVAISEFSRVIKPGGYIQWTEYDWDTWSFSKGPSNESYKAVVLALLKKHNVMVNISSDAPPLLSEMGFEDITVDFRSIPVGSSLGDEGMKGIHVIKSGFLAMKPAVLRYKGLGGMNSEEDYDSLVQAIEQEWMNGLGGEVTGFCVICARKAL
ncbi:hypothetical protein GYMLUDRAFT_64334 [Collybiopsis luxurians FD-317 M1]|uniref:Methyltransferase type 11 domain-containing protein n=1 Tax=Collybiopsis luxurians FD-317 M1 TaxID=944289 RepID=A0A0D0BCU4_9AGAR|nr:hypothetical protein GYMLUDRAFT_64334 [Collybiopsis luxurians FD-317 M1]